MEKTRDRSLVRHSIHLCLIAAFCAVSELLNATPAGEPRFSIDKELEAWAHAQHVMESVARDEQLTVVRQSLLKAPQESSAAFRSVGVTMSVRGPQDAIHRWLERLDAPSGFRTLTFLQLDAPRSGAQQFSCRVVVHQGFSTGRNCREEAAMPFPSGPSPARLLMHISECLPAREKVVLQRVEIRADRSTEGSRAEIVLSGEARNLENLKHFGANLNRARALSSFPWTSHAPSMTKEGNWAFRWNAATPKKPCVNGVQRAGTTGLQARTRRCPW